MTPLTDWARTWAIPDAALRDLHARLGALESVGPAPAAGQGASEAAVQARVRLAASQRGMRLWRNNVGVFHDTAAGVHVRFGLANDSPQLNAVIKSADLIGIRPRVIQQSDVGTLIGQFLSREVKHAAWRYTGTEREVAQLNWAKLITSLGGDAGFITSESMLA